MQVMEAIRARRSIRSFQARPIEPEKLPLIKEAFQRAPSARNLQDWRLVIVRSPAMKKAIRAASSMGLPMLEQAPVLLVSVGLKPSMMSNGHRRDTTDGSIALAFSILAAQALGLGTCWMADYDEGALRDILGLPAGASIVAIAPLGYPDEAPAARPRKAVEEVTEELL